MRVCEVCVDYTSMHVGSVCLIRVTGRCGFYWLSDTLVVDALQLEDDNCRYQGAGEKLVRARISRV